MKYLPEIIICFIFSILSTGNTLAQRLEDVVYLSNGSIIRGTILPDSTNFNLHILNHSGDVWSFTRTEIDSVKREKPSDYEAEMFSKPGIEMNVNAEFMARSGSNAIGKAIVPGVTLGLGYRFNHWVCSGAETGIEFYDLMEVPVAASLRLRASGRALSQFIIFRGGYTLSAEKHPDDWNYKYAGKGGPMLTVGTGIEKIISGNSSFLLSFSYHYQELNYHLTPLNQWVQERDRKESYSRFRISLGYVFK